MCFRECRSCGELALAMRTLDVRHVDLHSHNFNQCVHVNRSCFGSNAPLFSIFPLDLSSVTFQQPLGYLFAFAQSGFGINVLLRDPMFPLGR